MSCNSQQPNALDIKIDEAQWKREGKEHKKKVGWSNVHSTVKETIVRKGEKMLDELQTEKERWTMLLSPDSRGGGGRRRRQRENELVFSSCIDLTPQVSAMQPKSGVYATTPLVLKINSLATFIL